MNMIVGHALLKAGAECIRYPSCFGACFADFRAADNEWNFPERVARVRKSPDYLAIIWPYPESIYHRSCWFLEGKSDCVQAIRYVHRQICERNKDVRNYIQVHPSVVPNGLAFGASQICTKFFASQPASDNSFAHGIELDGVFPLTRFADQGFASFSIPIVAKELVARFAVTVGQYTNSAVRVVKAWSYVWRAGSVEVQRPFTDEASGGASSLTPTFTITADEVFNGNYLASEYGDFAHCDGTPTDSSENWQIVRLGVLRNQWETF